MKIMFQKFGAFILILVFALAILPFTPAPASAAWSDMWADVFSWDGGMNGDGTMKLTKITSGVTYQVLAVGADTEETLYAYNDNAFTSFSNVVTTTYFNVSDRVQFRVDPTDSTSDRYVDLIVVDTAGGFTAFVEDFDKYTHTIVIDERPNVMHHGVIWFAPSDNSATDTGVNFLPDTAILDVLLEVVTVDASETISVGTEDTAAGFRTGVSVATAGYIYDTGVITDGSTSDYFAATTYGALLHTAITGSDGAATSGGNSVIAPFVVTTAGTDDDLYYTGSAGSDTAVGYIHYFFTRMR
jgi:hypothetical protein